MERIPAIQTRYKGYHFRSRLEARWAVFFDACGIDSVVRQAGKGEHYPENPSRDEDIFQLCYSLGFDDISDEQFAAAKSARFEFGAKGK